MIYRVVWTIDVEADSPEEAAAKALTVQRNPESTATRFEVWRDDDMTTVDLHEMVYGEDGGNVEAPITQEEIDFLFKRSDDK